MVPTSGFLEQEFTNFPKSQLLKDLFSLSKSFSSFSSNLSWAKPSSSWCCSHKFSLNSSAAEIKVMRHEIEAM
jgi:hypothetical protein